MRMHLGNNQEKAVKVVSFQRNLRPLRTSLSDSPKLSILYGLNLLLL